MFLPWVRYRVLQAALAEGRRMSLSEAIQFSLEDIGQPDRRVQLKGQSQRPNNPATDLFE
jgi:hypothetical protein